MKIMRVIAYVVISAVIGGACTGWILSSLHKLETEYMLLVPIAFEEKDSTEQYLLPENSDNDRIRTLTHAIKFFRDYKNNGLVNDEISENFHHAVVVTHARLALTYEKSKMHALANEHFAAALSTITKEGLYKGWVGTDKEIREKDDLVKFVSELDERTRTQHKGG